jgi:hypothetical protein
MWRSVWAGHPQNHTIRDKERQGGSIVELTTIVALNNFDGGAKLCGDIIEKIQQSDESVRFESQRKIPHEI